MHWLLERDGSIQHFNQSMLLRLPATVTEEQLVGAVQVLLDHHDALRLRMVRAADSGDWSLEIPAPGTIVAAACVRRVDVSALDEVGPPRSHDRRKRERPRRGWIRKSGSCCKRSGSMRVPAQAGQASVEHPSSGRRRSLLADPGA